MQPNISSPLPGGGIAITLDRPRTLRFDFNALVALGEATGKNPLQGEFWRTFDEPKTQRAALWAALLHEDKALTLEQAGNLIDLDRLSEIMGAVAAAINAAMPTKKTEDAAA
jgi:hypothetical protein